MYFKRKEPKNSKIKESPAKHPHIWKIKNSKLIKQKITNWNRPQRYNKIARPEPSAFQLLSIVYVHQSCTRVCICAGIHSYVKLHRNPVFCVTSPSDGFFEGQRWHESLVGCSSNIIIHFFFCILSQSGSFAQRAHIHSSNSFIITFVFAIKHSLLLSQS